MPRSPLLVAALCLLFAAPAAAEFYRWRDASGREHFAQELHQVPPEHRAAAKAAAGKARDGGAINYLKVPKRTSRPVTPVADPGPAAPSPGSAGFDCAALRKQVKKKKKVIRTHRGSVEANLRWADDIEKSVYARRKYELRAEEEGRWLEKAEADLDRFVEEYRRKGAPPGCLR